MKKMYEVVFSCDYVKMKNDDGIRTIFLILKKVGNSEEEVRNTVERQLLDALVNRDLDWPTSKISIVKIGVIDEDGFKKFDEEYQNLKKIEAEIGLEF